MKPFLALCLAALPATARAGANDPVATGAALFAESCADCHGDTATEGESGDIRGLSASTVFNAIQGFEAMPSFELSREEAAAIAAYLAHLLRD